MVGGSSGWDPLEEAGDTDKELLSAAKKREIKNILKSYVSNYDPFSELLQNALDAVERRMQSGSSFDPKIWVRVDLQENSLEVVDNGCGFEAEEFRTFLAPSISFKAGGKTRGNKGVGVTYIAYGFNELLIRTKNSSYSYQGAIRRGREWIEDSEGTVPRPRIDATTAQSELFDALDQGTSFKIKFTGSHIRPSNLAWYQAQTAEQWLYLLLVKTPLKLRKGLRILRGGLQLANNHMPQGELITIPLTRSIGHQNQAHVIVHFEGADPDLGRKGFQPELKELAERLSVTIVRQLGARRDILKSDSGAHTEIDNEIKVHDWLKSQEQYETTHPLELTNQNFFLPMNRISIGSEPQSEQDVIVLFNQLLAGGVIRGIRLLATSQALQYDGVFRYLADEPLANHYFDPTTNPLGVLAEQLHSPYISPPKILEYKYSLDGLIREFEGEIKVQKDISLAIFWEMGSEYKKEYNVISLLDFDHVHQRKHHGLTHVLTSAHSRIDAICLKELIQLLNDPTGAQEFQKSQYGDE